MDNSGNELELRNQKHLEAWKRSNNSAYNIKYSFSTMNKFGCTQFDVENEYSMLKMNIRCGKQLFDVENKFNPSIKNVALTGLYST